MVKFLAITIAAVAGVGLAQAGDAPVAPAGCFDFAKVPTRLLRDHVAYAPGQNTAYGKLPDGGAWGAARASIKLSSAKVLAMLRDQRILKDPDDCELKITPERRAGYLDFQTVEIGISPMPLVNIRWREQWAYVLRAGTAERPKRAVVYYQKIDGTDHIRKFCGNIVLTAIAPDVTELSFYEEADATRRSPEDVMKGHLGTIQTLVGRRPASVLAD